MTLRGLIVTTGILLVIAVRPLVIDTYYSITYR